MARMSNVPFDMPEPMSSNVCSRFKDTIPTIQTCFTVDVEDPVSQLEINRNTSSEGVQKPCPLL
jgi:hypothetical protein